MEIFLSVLLFCFGLTFIMIGGNVLVKNALKISAITGIPEVLIGATIVSLATTLPELLVTVYSSIGQIENLAIGNAVGSIIFNLGFIIGLVLLFCPQNISNKKLKTNFYISFFTVVILIIFGVTNSFSKISGVILLIIFLAFFIINIFDANKQMLVEGISIQIVPKINKKKLLVIILAFIIGSTIVTLGAKILVDNGKTLALSLGVGEHIIGITIVAMGTSIPELVTAINSIRLKSTNLAIGNTLGANILSSTLLLGTSCITSVNQLQLNPNIVFVALPLIILQMLIIYLPIKKNNKSYRYQGVLLLVSFVMYYLSLFL